MIRRDDRPAGLHQPIIDGYRTRGWGKNRGFCGAGEPVEELTRRMPFPMSPTCISIIRVCRHDAKHSTEHYIWYLRSMPFFGAESNVNFPQNHHQLLPFTSHKSRFPINFQVPVLSQEYQNPGQLSGAHSSSLSFSCGIHPQAFFLSSSPSSLPAVPAVTSSSPTSFFFSSPTSSSF
jgi:hypothetical protein